MSRPGLMRAVITAAGAAAALSLSLNSMSPARARSLEIAGSPAFVAFGKAPRGVATPVMLAPQAVLEARAPLDGAEQSGSAFTRPGGLALGALCAAIAARVVGSLVTMGSRPFIRRKRSRPTDWKHDRLGYRIHGEPGYPGSPHAWTEPIRWVYRFKKRITIRRKVEGTNARPRLSVFRSQHHMHVNVIDDTVGVGITLASSNTKQDHNLEELRKLQGAEKGWEKTWSEAAAEVVGRDIAKKCLEKNITQIVFDRGGWPYEGRVKALAEAARSAGLQF